MLQFEAEHHKMMAQAIRAAGLDARPVFDFGYPERPPEVKHVDTMASLRHIHEAACLVGCRAVVYDMSAAVPVRTAIVVGLGR